MSNIVGRANRSLGFVKRNLNKCPEEVKKQAYYTLVRPKSGIRELSLGPTYQEGDQCYFFGLFYTKRKKTPPCYDVYSVQSSDRSERAQGALYVKENWSFPTLVFAKNYVIKSKMVASDLEGSESFF